MEVPTLCCNILAENHTLIAGSTGSGKSVLINSIIYTALAYGNKHLLLIDPKRVDLAKYKKIADGYACELEQEIDLIDFTIGLMEKRFKQMQKQGLELYNGEDIYLIIDELADLMISPKRRDILLKLQRLLALGRASRIHVIAATQIPNRKILPAELQLNFTCIVGLKTRQAIESRQIIGMNGCETLPKYGQGYVIRSSEPLELWEIPLTDADKIKSAIANVPKPTFFTALRACFN